MIKFFRDIRKNLLAQGKTVNPIFAKASAGMYLKYAFGEIVLVVIGILIALQLNNWNEDRKILKEEQKSLEKLHEESEIIVGYLTTMCDRYEELINTINKSAKALNEKDLNDMKEDEFAFGIYSTAYFEAISPPKSVFEELNSTGKIQNIGSEIVRKSISEYYAQLDYTNTQLVYFRNQFTKPVDEGGEDFIYVYDETSSSKLKPAFNFKNLSNNKLFISKHIKALRDQIAFNDVRKSLSNYAIIMCQQLSKELKVNCSSSDVKISKSYD